VVGREVLYSVVLVGLLAIDLIHHCCRSFVRARGGDQKEKHPNSTPWRIIQMLDASSFLLHSCFLSALFLISFSWD